MEIPWTTTKVRASWRPVSVCSINTENVSKGQRGELSFGCADDDRQIPHKSWGEETIPTHFEQIAEEEMPQCLPSSWRSEPVTSSSTLEVHVIAGEKCCRKYFTSPMLLCHQVAGFTQCYNEDQAGHNLWDSFQIKISSTPSSQ